MRNGIHGHGPRLLFLKIAAERDLPMPNEERCLIGARLYPANGGLVPWSLVETSQGQETDCVSDSWCSPETWLVRPRAIPLWALSTASTPSAVPSRFPGRPLFAFLVCCSFLPPPVRACLSPCSSIKSAPKLLPSCPRHGPRRIPSFPSSSPTTIAATPFPRHTTHFPSFGSPSQVDLDRPPPLLRQLEDSNIHSSTDTAT